MYILYLQMVVNKLVCMRRDYAKSSSSNRHGYNHFSHLWVLLQQCHCLRAVDTTRDLCLVSRAYSFYSYMIFLYGLHKFLIWTRYGSRFRPHRLPIPITQTPRLYYFIWFRCWTLDGWCQIKGMWASFFSRRFIHWGDFLGIRSTPPHTCDLVAASSHFSVEIWY